VHPLHKSPICAFRPRCQEQCYVRALSARCLAGGLLVHITPFQNLSSLRSAGSDARKPQASRAGLHPIFVESSPCVCSHRRTLTCDTRFFPPAPNCWHFRISSYAKSAKSPCDTFDSLTKSALVASFHFASHHSRHPKSNSWHPRLLGFDICPPDRLAFLVIFRLRRECRYGHGSRRSTKRCAE
jgi:hypothetical protein